MDINTATEIAYKNGYAKAVRDVFEDIEKSCGTFLAFGIHGYAMCDIEKLKKKYIPDDCRKCKYFVGCECFSGKICDQYEVKK